MKAPYETHLALRAKGYTPHSLVLDLDAEMANFLLYQPKTLALVGVLEYNWLGAKKPGRNVKGNKYFSQSVRGKLGVYGMESVTDWDEVVYVVEGVWDAIALHALGYQAVAVLTCNPKAIRKWLKSFNSVALCDGDAAGLTLQRNTKYFMHLDENKDVSDLDNLEEYMKCLDTWLAKLIASSAPSTLEWLMK